MNEFRERMDELEDARPQSVDDYIELFEDMIESDERDDRFFQIKGYGDEVTRGAHVALLMDGRVTGGTARIGQNIRKLYIGNKITSIDISEEGEPFAPSRENLTHLLFQPDSTCKLIGMWSFPGCTSLSSIEIPDSVETIGRQAFYQCSDLYEVIFGEGVRIIEEEAFADCAIEKLHIPNGVVEIGDRAFSTVFRGPDYEQSDYTLQRLTGMDGVTSLGAECFMGQANIERVALGGSVTSIGEGCFRDCEDLKRLLLTWNHDLVIGEDAFDGCDSIEAVRLIGGPSPEAWKNKIGDLFDGLRTISGQTAVWQAEFTSRPGYWPQYASRDWDTSPLTNFEYIYNGTMWMLQAGGLSTASFPEDLDDLLGFAPVDL